MRLPSLACVRASRPVLHWKTAWLPCLTFLSVYRSLFARRCYRPARMLVGPRGSRELVRVIWVFSVLSALGGCSVDNREVRVTDRALADGEGDQTVSTNPNEPSKTGAEEDQTVATCESPSCPGEMRLQQDETQGEAASQLSPGDAGTREVNMVEVESSIDAGPPQTKLALGEPCDESNICSSGDCRLTESSVRVCCRAGCDSAEVCGASGETCVTPKATQGTACVVDDECLSGSCTDGVCCQEACDGVCETCANSGVCRAPLDDNACPTVRCSALNATCADTTADIQTNRCESKGVCKSLDACGLAPAGVECVGGFCDNGGRCRAPTVNCGGACETTGLVPGRTCCSVNTTLEFICVDERGCGEAGDRTVICDEHRDCVEGSVCCSSDSPSGVEIFCVPEADCVRTPGIRASLRQICGAPGASSAPCPQGEECRLNPSDTHLPDWSLCRPAEPDLN